MNRSNVTPHDLRRLETAAWTELLRRHAPLNAVNVARVDLRPGPTRRHTHYLLSLEGYSDGVPLWGTETTETEVAFYRELAPAVRRLVPRCWLVQEQAGEGWLLLDEVPARRYPHYWTPDDAERAIALLASLHGTFWEAEGVLATSSWLPQPFQFPGRKLPPGYLAAWQFWDEMTGGGSALSYQGRRNAGNLAPAFIRAAAGLEILRRLGGWPGVVEKRHLETMGELLDDPAPMLQPLRELPQTLLHGNPAPRHWRVTLSGDQRLIDWRQVQAGPGILDLVTFLEAVARRPGWPVDEETMVDSYLLRLHMGLPGFDARAARQALPAALCLHVLITWLPRFADWFQPFLHSPRTWASLLAADAPRLERLGYGRMADERAYLVALFTRFWHASKML